MNDVVIIGGGICGCSLLYALSRYKLDVVLLEAENDVGVGTTKANSAIVHAGYDPAPGTLMARYNVEGNALIHQLCKDLDVLLRPTGSLVIGFDDADRDEIEKLYRQGIQNGVPGLRILAQKELHSMEPALSPDANCALYAPSAGVVNTWELALAQAEAAVLGGSTVKRNARVTAIRPMKNYFEIQTEAETLQARFVVNAAGVASGAVAAMVEEPEFAILPSRGQYYLLDTSQGELVQRIIFQCPTPKGKGVLVAPTAHGNLIVGPSAESANDVSTTAEGLRNVAQTALRSVPGIQFRESIRNFAGLRAVSDQGDFIVGPSASVPGFFNIAGIKSPGLTAAPSIALDVVRMLQAAGLGEALNPRFCASRSVFRFKYLPREARAAAIAQNPLYGQIVCRCETVTEGEIVDAMHRPLPPLSVDAAKRRCTTGMGRCQGGFCGPRVQAILARELGVPQTDVPMDARGTTLIIGETKQEGALR